MIFVGVANQRRSSTEIEFLAQAGNMYFGRAFGDVQFLCYFLV